jgi:hypothetical protein
MRSALQLATERNKLKTEKDNINIINIVTCNLSNYDATQDGMAHYTDPVTVSRPYYPKYYKVKYRKYNFSGNSRS